MTVPLEYLEHGLAALSDAPLWVHSRPDLRSYALSAALPYIRDAQSLGRLHQTCKAFEKYGLRKNDEILLILTRNQKLHIRENRHVDPFTSLLHLIRNFDPIADLMNDMGIIDVSALGRVHSLNLSHDSASVDVSALGRVHSLNLSHDAGTNSMLVPQEILGSNNY